MQWQPFRVTVTQDLIEQGCDEPTNCPVALAFMAAGCTNVSAHYHGVEFRLHGHTFQTDMPDFLNTWLDIFDTSWGDMLANETPRTIAFTVHPTHEQPEFHFRAVITN